MTIASQKENGPGPSPYVKEITVQNFMQEVIQASLQLPVLVYFTATWCQPCKQYGPMLEKVVGEAKGKVRLARVDIDKNPQLAQQFRIQSVPMVYVFSQGQPLDAFAGVVPESQLRQMIAQLGGTSPEAEMALATLEVANQLLADGNVEDAFEVFQALLGQDEQSVDAKAGLARCLIALGQLPDAEALLASVPADKQNHELVAAAKAALSIAKAVPKSADEGSLRKRIEADPKDFQAQYDLAGLLFPTGRQEEAIAQLLAIITRNKNWNEGAARAQLLTFFEALGHTHPLTMQGRRKLSTLLFS